MYEVEGHSKEKVILVNVIFHSNQLRGWGIEESVKEFKELALSSGVEVIDDLLAKVEEPTPNYLIGKGKVEEIHGLIHAHSGDAKAVLLSENLSSTQQRNLQDILQVKTIDRTQLILDVFSQRAHTNEGKLQVELAQLEYLLPRLSGLGIKLSRLGGGIGTRGPGEKMLEVDRRAIRRRISNIKKDLDSLRQRRGQLRRDRMEHSLATVAIVGYTNAGKSTLMNSLTQSNIAADNRLFCTLDPTARRYTLPNRQKILFVDTVGFIHNLPHNLVESFKATLEEVKDADLLLHVLDISSSTANQQYDAVYEVLKELGAEQKPIITALNKVDLIENRYVVERFKNNIADSYPISALEKGGFSFLADAIGKRLSGLVRTIEVFLPHNKMAMVNRLYEEGQVLEKEYTAEGVRIKAIVPVKLAETFGI